MGEDGLNWAIQETKGNLKHGSVGEQGKIGKTFCFRRDMPKSFHELLSELLRRGIGCEDVPE